MSKLNYTILPNRRKVHFKDEVFDYIDVEWRHDDGPFVDKELIPITHPPNIQYEESISGTRDVVIDQIIVPSGTKDSVVMQMLEEKKEALAKNLGVEP